MARDILKSIKTCEVIFSNGQDVLIGGKSLWLFRANGEFVKKVLPIRRPYKVAFLPNRTALVDGVADHAYYYLNLEVGEILWVVKKTQRRSGETPRFVVSPDGSMVYNLFYSYRNGRRVLHAERMIPEKRIYNIFAVEEPLGLASGGLCMTRDMFCDSDGILCAFQAMNITRYEDYDYMETPNAVFHYGILALPFQNDVLHPYWKRHWETERTGKWNNMRACDERYVLFEDLSVLDMETQETFFLLNESDRESLSPCSFRYFYDSERFLLTLWRLDDKQSAVIDCKNRKLIGQYFGEPGLESPGSGGWVIGNEFWLGTSKGVARYPFPNVNT